MKKFLLKISLFFGLLALIPAGLFAVYFFGLRSISFAQPEDTKILFIGDSHIEAGVNDSLIPNAFNFANSGEGYFYQYARLKKFLNDNPQIEVVFITATPHSLAKYGDERIFGGYGLQNIAPFVYPLFDLQTWKIFLRNNKTTDILQHLKERTGRMPLWDAGVLFMPKKVIARLGSFKRSQGRNLEKSISAQQDPSAKGNLHGDESYGNALQIEYLRKIVDFTRSRGARIIFLNPPIYHAREFFDVPYFENLLKTEFPDVEFWNYMDFPVDDDRRQDINHLNQWGAEVFSKELARRIDAEEILKK